MKRLGWPIWLLLLWVVVALLQPLLPIEPNQIGLERILHGPDGVALLGYDDLGRDLLHRLIAGSSTSLMVAFWAVVVSALIGTALGTISGYIGGAWDLVTVRLIDIFLAFPGILQAIALAGLLGPGIDNVIIALAAVGWVGYARLARAQVLSLKHREHVEAAIALGTTTPRILTRHLLPLILTPLMIEATFGIASAIIAEAGLSFLGLGVQPPEASWGSMIREGVRYMLVAPHMVIVPGMALMMVVFAVNLAGDRLRDIMATHADSDR
ncbi:ABC transporter permease [Solemya pervernicosa gill symbiont]|uniref:ABC transporter permease n=2 Tax=Gammaproteobacteria incertae sedis TaxID=118884 RepID=A0A1T2LAH1_9GAMM|nr:ABC transporter permease [Candidatus Reidiella endopervernicosa]OOZ42044.1 ABC transporter permease [Solemya pervernicosa gill symbiont]QKQ27007.1 ABC transporter permease [Candidatus Reidiella endopervernicosa]